jgi:hypothetical protein
VGNSAHNTIWETYTRSWSVSEDQERVALFEQCLGADCLYSDPVVQTSGYAELSAYMAELLRNMPGARFVTTDFVSHHNQSLAHWNMLDGHGDILSQGASHGLYGADGRLIQMSGFFALPETN